jgi:hypothetical protein
MENGKICQLILIERDQKRGDHIRSSSRTPQHVGNVPGQKGEYVQTSRTKGSNSSLALNGTIRTLVGATTGGKDNTWESEMSIGQRDRKGLMNEMK